MGELSEEDLKEPKVNVTKVADEDSERMGEGKEEEPKREHRKPSYAGAIILNLILLYVVNNLLNWHVPFMTKSFVAVLTLINISLLGTIVANILFLAHDRGRFRHLLQLVLNVIAFVVTYTIYVIFPFDFRRWPGISALDFMVKIGLILGMVGIAIGTIVEFFRLIFAPANKK